MPELPIANNKAIDGSTISAAILFFLNHEVRLEKESVKQKNKVAANDEKNKVSPTRRSGFWTGPKAMNSLMHAQMAKVIPYPRMKYAPGEFLLEYVLNVRTKAVPPARIKMPQPKGLFILDFPQIQGYLPEVIDQLLTST